MPSFLAYPLEIIPYVLVTLLIAFTIHEWAHALVALAFGDDTAKNEGDSQTPWYILIYSVC